MKHAILLIVLASLARAAPLVSSNGPAGVWPDRYIVMLHDGHTHATFQPAFDQIAQQFRNEETITAMATDDTVQVHHKFENIPGFVTTIRNREALQELLKRPEVKYVEHDGLVTTMGIQRGPPSWGLARISERKAESPTPFLYNDLAGQGVTAYVLDTGVQINHTDFGGRAVKGANFVKDENDDDIDGHGTHVASTIGGTMYGVAKNVTLVAVKVLHGGNGSSSDVIAGMDWVIGDVRNSGRGLGKTIVNMSLGGGQSQSVDDAANRMYQANIPIFASAGNNETIDACTRSPAGTADTFTVAASDEMDQFASFSSFGSCVNIIAPGVNITAAWIGSSRTAVDTISGTSMATPHVAGVAALLLSQFNLDTVPKLFDTLKKLATKDTIKGVIGLTPNLFVYNGGEMPQIS